MAYRPSESLRIENARLYAETQQLRRYLRTALSHMDELIVHTTEVGCTCVDRMKGHEVGCSGIRYTTRALRFVRRVRG